MLLDFSAFEALFKLHYKSLAQTAFRIVNDKDVAEDLVQDIFCKLWEKRSELQINTSVKSYLYQSTINHSLNYLKKLKRAEIRDVHFYSSTSAEENTSDRLFAVKEMSERVQIAVNLLPGACRNVFILSRFEHLSYKQIAATLNISVKTVENQMIKALKHLRKHLGCVIEFLIFLMML